MGLLSRLLIIYVSSDMKWTKLVCILKHLFLLWKKGMVSKHSFILIKSELNSSKEKSYTCQAAFLTCDGTCSWRWRLRGIREEWQQWCKPQGAGGWLPGYRVQIPSDPEGKRKGHPGSTSLDIEWVRFSPVTKTPINKNLALTSLHFIQGLMLWAILLLLPYFAFLTFTVLPIRGIYT